MARRCSRTACSGAAVATLTYVYADQSAVLGPLATYAEPHTYDLCARHAERLSAPRGWDTVRLVDDLDHADTSAEGLARAGEDDLLAVADAVSESGRVQGRPQLRPAGSSANGTTRRRSAGTADDPRDERGDDPGDAPGTVELGRRGHLRVLRDR